MSNEQYQGSEWLGGDDLAPLSNTLDDDSDIMLTTFEQQIKTRQEELLAMDTLTLTRQIIVKAIAEEEAKSAISSRSRMNLAGIGMLLKLLLSMDGVERAMEQDIEVDLPEDMTKAIDTLIKLRAKGKLKSLQGKDLSELLNKRREWKDVQELAELARKLLEENNLQLMAPTLKITKREEKDLADAV